jgi:hypothetical protein
MGGLITLIIMGLIYFIPTIIANNRNHKQFTAIFILNLFAGWTGLGWLAALIWSVTND